MFKQGQRVEHVLNKEYMLVLEKGKEQYKCRTKDFREIWFYEFELKAI